MRNNFPPDSPHSEVQAENANFAKENYNLASEGYAAAKLRAIKSHAALGAANKEDNEARIALEEAEDHLEKMGFKLAGIPR